MSVTSPLASLYTVLQAVRSNAELNALLLRKNEAATRAALIDPVLRALGWDTTNVQMVEPEKTINTAWRADYALRDTAGEIVSLIEAKCLGSDLEKFSVVQQLLSYAFGFGVHRIVITDGLSWHFYSEFKPGNSHSNASFNLLHDNLSVCVLHLIQWLDAAQSGHGITLPVPPEPEATAAPVLAKATKQPTPQKAAIEQSEFIELTHLNSLPSLPEQKPRQLRLPDGSVVTLKTWKDILHRIGEFVLAQNPTVTLPYPDKADKKTALLSMQKPKAGLSSSTFTHQGKPLFLYTNYSAPACIANALHLLKLVPTNMQQISPAVTF